MVSQRTTKHADQAPIGMNPHSMHDDKPCLRVGGLGVNGQEFAPGPSLQVDGIAHDEARGDLISPFLLPGIVGAVGELHDGQHEQGGQRQAPINDPHFVSHPHVQRQQIAPCHHAPLHALSSDLLGTENADHSQRRHRQSVGPFLESPATPVSIVTR